LTRRSWAFCQQGADKVNMGAGHNEYKYE
jgi:hypothetical protein